MTLLPRIFRPKSKRLRLNLTRKINTRLDSELSSLRAIEPSACGVAAALDAVRATRTEGSRAKPSPRKRLLPRICLGTVFVLGAYAGCYWISIERDPSPAPEAGYAVVTPNAFDTYSAASGNANLNTSGELPQFDSTGNWMEVVRDAAASTKIPLSLHDRLYQIQRDLLNQNASVLRQTRDGLHQMYFAPVRLNSETDQSDSTYEAVVVQRFKKLWSLLMLESEEAHERGDENQRVQSVLDALQFATQIQCNTTLIPKLSGVNWEIAPRDTLWNILPNADTKTLREVILRLDEIIHLSEQSHLNITLQNELIRGRRGMLELFRQPGWRWRMAKELAPQDASFPKVVFDFARLCRYSKREIYTHYEQAARSHIDRVSRPYSNNWSKNEAFSPDDPICQRFIPVYDAVKLFDTVSRTENELLRTTAQIYLFKKENGHFPVSLQELEGGRSGEDTRPHSDPFAPWQNPPAKLKYRRRNGNFLLYSIGPDSRDNGGSAIVNAPIAGANSGIMSIMEESHGDILAGYNRSWRHR